MRRAGEPLLTFMPTLEQATAARLSDIVAMYDTGITELTGKAIREYGTEGAFVGRYGGLKPSFPELERIPDSPKTIAAAIRRGSGKVFNRVERVVTDAMLKEGFEPKKISKRSTPIPPHDGRPYCIHCREFHTRGAHRSHGAGSFHRTHLFSFGANPVNVQQAKKYFAHLMKISRERPLTTIERERLKRASQIIRYSSRRTASGNPKRSRRNPKRKVISFRQLPMDALFRFEPDAGMYGGQTWRKVGKEEFRLPSEDEQAKLYRRRSFVILPHAKVSLIETGSLFAGPLFDNRRRPRKNVPGGAIRLGKVVEIRYERDHGAKPGFYKHTFKQRPDVFYDPRRNMVYFGKR